MMFFMYIDMTNPVVKSNQGIPSLAVSQGAAKVKLYMGHITQDNCAGKILKILRDYVELVIGCGRCFLQHPEINQKNWVPITGSWIRESSCIPARDT